MKSQILRSPTAGDGGAGFNASVDSVVADINKFLQMVQGPSGAINPALPAIDILAQEAVNLGGSLAKFIDGLFQTGQIDDATQAQIMASYTAAQALAASWATRPGMQQD